MTARLGSFAFMVCAGFLIIQGNIHACSCLFGYSVENKVAHSSSVFLGRVIATSLDDNMGTYITTFEVLKVWKGQQTSPIKIKAAIYNSMCGVVFNTGWVYLVFSYGAETDFCLGSYDANLATDDLQKLGKPFWINPKGRPWNR
jgi:hypothetical protein